MKHISSLQNNWSEFKNLAISQYQDFLNQAPSLPPLNIKISEMSFDEKQHFEFWLLKINNNFLYIQLEDELENTYDLMFIDDELPSQYWEQFKIKQIKVRDDDFPYRLLHELSEKIEDDFNKTDEYQDHSVFNDIKVPFLTPSKIILFICILLILIFILFSTNFFIVSIILGLIVIVFYLVFGDFNPKKTARLNKLIEYKQAYIYSVSIELRQILKLKFGLENFDFKEFKDSNVQEGENFFMNNEFINENNKKIRIAYFMLFSIQNELALNEPHQVSINLDLSREDYLKYKEKGLL